MHRDASGDPSTDRPHHVIPPFRRMRGFRHVEPHEPDAVGSFQPAESRDAVARPRYGRQQWRSTPCASVSHHHDVMRERMVWYVVSSFESSKYDIPPMPDSIIPGPQQRPIRCTASQGTSRPASAGRVACSAGPDWCLMPVASRRDERKSRSSKPMPATPSGESAARKQRPGRCSRCGRDRGSSHAASRLQAQRKPR